MNRAPDSDIVAYRSTDDDRALTNPYLGEVLEALSRIVSRGGDPREELPAERAALVQKYAFSIPTAGVIRRIAAASPLLEIGAGSGYWAMCLAAAGADIIAVDHRPPGEGSPWDIAAINQWFEDTWYPVDEGGAATAGIYPERTLLLCWPPIDDSMAEQALRLYREAGGSTLVFIGDITMSGDRAFRESMERLPCLERRRIPGWPGLQEELIICSCR